MGSADWAEATARAFAMLVQEACAEVPKPEWWNDEELKALSARVVQVAPNDMHAHSMRGAVLCGLHHDWEVGHRSAGELEEAATHYDRAAALSTAPGGDSRLRQSRGHCPQRAGRDHVKRGLVTRAAQSSRQLRILEV